MRCRLASGERRCYVVLGKVNAWRDWASWLASIGVACASSNGCVSVDSECVVNDNILRVFCLPLNSRSRLIVLFDSVGGFAQLQDAHGREGGDGCMREFFNRLQWKMSAWMQGRYGSDNLSNALIIAGLVFTVLSVVPGFDFLSLLAFVLLALALFRCFSRNGYRRASENEAYLRFAAKPKRAFSLVGKVWKNRKTTCYFKCKNCGTVLSVPRGKGKLRVTCPQCHEQTLRKS